MEPKREMKRKESMFDIIPRRPSHITNFTVHCVKPELQEPEPMTLVDQSHPMKPDIPFTVDRVQKIIEQTLEENLQGKSYEEQTTKILALHISNEIREKVKPLHSKRYKYICTVTIGEKKRQALIVGRKVLQDADTDGYAEAIFHNNSLVAYAVVIALYCE